MPGKQRQIYDGFHYSTHAPRALNPDFVNEQLRPSWLRPAMILKMAGRGDISITKPTTLLPGAEQIQAECTNKNGRTRLICLLVGWFGLYLIRGKASIKHTPDHAQAKHWR